MRNKDFVICAEEYIELEKKFGKLCHYSGWQLLKRNTRNNHALEETDIAQELFIALIDAGYYHKRQTYIEKCLDLCMKYTKDKMSFMLVESLCDLWKNKTRHGAGKQTFGQHQEQLLEQLVLKVVPKSKRPCSKAYLVMDNKFINYCKRIIWNKNKAIGKKITREKGLRCGAIDISEHEYLLVDK